MTLNPIWTPVLKNLAIQPDEVLPLEGQRNLISNAHFMAESLFQAADMLAIIAMSLEKPDATLSKAQCNDLAREIRQCLARMGAFQILTMMALAANEKSTAAN